MSADILYIRAAKELKSKAGTRRDEALWAQAQELAGGNQIEARNNYVNLRVEQMKQGLTAEQAAVKSATSETSVINHPDYISVAKYSARNNVDENHVIQSIKDGHYKGRQVGGDWYIFIGKSRFGSYKDNKSKFFFDNANELAESRLSEDDPDKVIDLQPKR